MSAYDDLSEQAGDLVESWPPGGLVVGLLPDPSHPEWAGRAVLALAFAAADRRKPPLIFDLAPERTDLASRFGAEDGAGIAERVDGAVELWEIVHRHARGNAFYLPCGHGTPGAELVRSPSAVSLAERVRSDGRIALVSLDRRGAGEAASAGWVDGFVRLGDRGVSSTRLSSDVGVLGDLDRRKERGAHGTDEPPATGPGDVGKRKGRSHRTSSGRQKGVRRRQQGDGEPRQQPGTESRQQRSAEPRRERNVQRPHRGTTGSGLTLPRRRRSRGVLRRAVRALVFVAILAAGGLTASTWLGGPGWTHVRDAAGTVAGEVGDAVPAGPGSSGVASDSASRSGADPEGPARADSLRPSPGDTAEPGRSGSR